MRRLVIHFGMAKTGSTSIQSVLAESAPRADFQYLCVDGAANAGRTLTAAFATEPERLNVHRRLGLSVEALSAQREHVLSSLETQLARPASVFVLSTEMLSLLDEAGLCRLRDWLSARVDRIELFGYVRDPASFMESMFQQSLKASRSSFDAALRYPAYRERFERFERVFGPESVRYRAFTPSDFPGQCVVRDFLAQCELDLEPGLVPRSNESLTLDGVGLLYIIRRHGEPVGRGAGALSRNRRLVRLLREVPGPKFRLHRSLTEPRIQMQEEDMQWISARLGRRLQARYPADAEAAIRSEDDLLNVSRETALWLRQRLGLEVEPGREGRRALARALQAEGFKRGRADAVEGDMGMDAEPLAVEATPVRLAPPVLGETAVPAAEPAGRLAQADLVDAVRARVAGQMPVAPGLDRVVVASLEVLAARLGSLDRGLTVEGLGEFLRRRGAKGGRTVFFRPFGAGTEGERE